MYQKAVSKLMILYLLSGKDSICYIMKDGIMIVITIILAMIIKL